MKMDLDAFGIMRPQMKGIESSLYATKKQLYLPAIRIQHDDFVGIQVETISRNEIGFTQGDKGH